MARRFLSGHHATADGGGRQALRVAAVQADARFGAYLEAVFRHAGGLVLERTFACGAAFLAELERARWAGAPMRWDLVMVDLEAPGLAGPPSMRRIRQELPAACVVAVTAFGDSATILEAIRAGADGWVPKYTPADRLLGELGAVLVGGGAPPADLVPTPIDIRREVGRLRQHPRGEAAPPRPHLTAREEGVLRCLVQGKSYKATACELGISLDTARSHIRSIYAKLGVHTVAEAVALALRAQLV